MTFRLADLIFARVLRWLALLGRSGAAKNAETAAFDAVFAGADIRIIRTPIAVPLAAATGAAVEFDSMPTPFQVATLLATSLFTLVISAWRTVRRCTRSPA